MTFARSKHQSCISKACFMINHKTCLGDTALMFASCKGHSKVVQLLAENGATLNIVCHDNTTPIYIAAHYNHLDVICVLLKFGANINFGKYGKIPPLTVATLNDAHETMAFLISHGCSFICEWSEQSPLAIAE